MIDSITWDDARARAGLEEAAGRNCTGFRAWSKSLARLIFGGGS